MFRVSDFEFRVSGFEFTLAARIVLVGMLGFAGFSIFLAGGGMRVSVFAGGLPPVSS